MKFNFNDYKGDYVMHCKTEEEAEEFCKLMHEDGRKWCSGESYVERLTWDIYKMDMCYNFNSGKYCDVPFYIRRDYKVLEWADFKEKPTFTDDTLRGYKSIYLNGVTIAIPLETIVGIAYKNPDDEYDAEMGEALAYFRMEGEE